MLSLERIREACDGIDPVFLNSPQIEMPSLSRRLGADVVLKVETLNPIRSFKGRGGWRVVHEQPQDARLVAASAGNFGQGLAYAASSRGMQLTVFAAKTANPLKVERMRELGAAVVLEGEDFDGAKNAARAYAARAGGRFIEDGREPAISEGAGTIGVELLRSAKSFDSLAIALGNGAMIVGIGAWVKAHSPGTKVIGVCASGAPSMALSWKAGRVQSTAEARTIADGIAVRNPVPEALIDMGGVVDDVLLVDEAAILRAMRLIFSETGLVVEPSGAVGVAAIAEHRTMFAGQRVGTVLCGGNVTDEQFREWFGGR